MIAACSKCTPYTWSSWPFGSHVCLRIQKSFHHRWSSVIPLLSGVVSHSCHRPRSIFAHVSNMSSKGWLLLWRSGRGRAIMEEHDRPHTTVSSCRRNQKLLCQAIRSFFLALEIPYLPRWPVPWKHLPPHVTSSLSILEVSDSHCEVT